MQRGGSDRFSCSTRFCCNSEKKVNFNSVNIKNNSLVDWIQSKESIDPTDSPNFILTCDDGTSCIGKKPPTPIKYESSDEHKSLDEFKSLSESG
ncbi:hypothetical protein HMI54_005879, partial [Coelomomyces lativittatus]